MDDTFLVHTMICVGILCFVLLILVAGWFSQRRKTREQAQRAKEHAEKRLADRHAYRYLMESVNERTIIEATGVTLAEVNHELGFPALWREFTLAMSNLELLLAVGAKILTVGIEKTKGLDELWLEAMNEVVARTPIETLELHLAEYARSIKCKAFEDKVIPRFSDTLVSCWGLAKTLGYYGREKCQDVYEEIVSYRAAMCTSPGAIYSLLESIPFGQQDQPFGTDRAISYVLSRMREIYNPLVADATDITTLDDLKLPDSRYYKCFHSFVELHQNIANKRAAIQRAEIRRLAGLEQ